MLECLLFNLKSLINLVHCPALAYIFIGFYKSKRLNEYNLNEPKFHLRYIHEFMTF